MQSAHPRQLRKTDLPTLSRVLVLSDKPENQQACFWSLLNKIKALYISNTGTEWELQNNFIAQEHSSPSQNAAYALRNYVNLTKINENLIQEE